MSVKIGITGGIGSGKSVVARLFRIMGIPVYDTDTEAKKLTHSDSFIKEQLILLLGQEIYKEGVLNRPFLANYIFGNPAHAATVNAIIHPRVREHLLEWLEVHAGFEIVAIESAILLESGFAQYVDKIMLVTAPMELRLERAITRDGTSKELIMNRIRSQMDDNERKLHADFIVINNDLEPLLPQVIGIIKSMKGKILS